MLQFQWGAHQLANQQFADVVLRHYKDGDIVWVQVRTARAGPAAAGALRKWPASRRALR